MGKKLEDKRRAIEIRMTIIAELLEKGYNYKQIQQEVMARTGRETLSTGTITADVRRLMKEYRQERLIDMDEVVTLELAKLNRIIRTAWEAWERSLEPGENIRTKRKGVPATGQTTGQKADELTTLFIEQTKEKFRGCGDAKYLDIILRAMERRHRILGLDRVAVDMSGAVQADVTISHVASGYTPASSEAEVREREGIEI